MQRHSHTVLVEVNDWSHTRHYNYPQRKLRRLTVDARLGQLVSVDLLGMILDRLKKGWTWNRGLNDPPLGSSPTDRPSISALTSENKMKSSPRNQSAIVGHQKMDDVRDRTRVHLQNNFSMLLFTMHLVPTRTATRILTSGSSSKVSLETINLILYNGQQQASRDNPANYLHRGRGRLYQISRSPLRSR